LSISHTFYRRLLFIMGLKLLSSPRTARRGNLLGALGMLIAMSLQPSDRAGPTGSPLSRTSASSSLDWSSAERLASWLAKRVQMTAMPQMVGVLNGLGGGASVLVAYAEYLEDEAIRESCFLPPPIST
jgi:NAD(P) transhydrogenase subunit beta